jgi:hypothetical protein
MKTTPPALAAGTERGKPGDVSDPGAYESGPNAACHATDGDPQPGLIAIIPGGNSDSLLDDTPTYKKPVTGEYPGPPRKPSAYVLGASWYSAIGPLPTRVVSYKYTDPDLPWIAAIGSHPAPLD